MKILAVVTLVSPNGEYGGPLRVAVNQLQALAERGHEVVLAGAHRGFGSVAPRAVEGIPARLFPARNLMPGTGFAGLTAPRLLWWIRSHAAEFDVVHVHAARDLVTLPVARIAQHAGVRTVLQTHGMIDESRRLLARPLDAVLTRPALDRAGVVTYLTPEERLSLEVVSRGRAKLAELANGVPIASAARPVRRTTEVLFLARLAPRKHPVLFTSAAIALARRYAHANFTLVGPDEGEGAAVSALIAASDVADRVRWEGPLAPETTIARMAESAVYVLPSTDEPYPMSVLEAMSVGLPVIVTESCGLAPFVQAHEAGVVIEPKQDRLESAISQLLDDPNAARRTGIRGQQAVISERSMDAVAVLLEGLYVGVN